MDTQIIGHSVQGRPIYAYHTGAYDTPQIIVTGATHAREWITALLVDKLAQIYEPTSGPASHYGLWFIPVCNPDGVRIANTTNPMWKANARGVDLNVNFDADWGKGVQNVRTSGAENYIGEAPHSEPETRALVDFTRAVNPALTIAYHSKGEVIYHMLNRDAWLANLAGDITGYAVEKTVGSCGGYSDWVAMKLGIPAITIEVGNDAHPHPIDTKHLPKILEQNRDILLYLQHAKHYNSKSNQTRHPTSHETVTHDRFHRPAHRIQRS